VVVILDLLDNYETVILSLEEVVVFIVDEVVHSTGVLSIRLLLSRVAVERISTILISLVLHECLGEECLVVILDLVDEFFHFSFEFEFELFLGVDHGLRPLHLRLRGLSYIKCISILLKLMNWLSHALAKMTRSLTLMGS
jgi:hypothetical protein